MPDHLFTLLPQVFVYLVLVVFVVGFVGSQLAQASEGFAKVFGPLGRYWRRKLNQERNDRIEEFRREAKLAVDSELGVVRKAEYASLKQQLIDVLDRVAEMERNEVIYQAYTVEDAEWHRSINIKLAEMGVLESPLPDRIPFSQFNEQYRKARGWNKPPKES